MSITQSIQPGVALSLMTDVALSGAPVTGTAYAMPARACAMKWQTKFATAPAAVSISLDFSIDKITWDSVDATTDVNGEVRTFTSVGGGFVRARLVSATNGTTVSVDILFNPA